MKPSRTRLVVGKEFRHLRRNPRILLILLVVPTLMMLLIGYAFSGDIKHIPTTVVDDSQSRLSHRFLDALKESEVAEIKLDNVTWTQAQRWLDEGRVKAALRIPATFEVDVARKNGTLQLVLDGSDPTSASVLAAAVREIAIAFSPTLAVKVDSQVLFNPELRYIEFIAPGAVSLILQTLPTLLIALAVAGEKERGTIEQLVATPIGKMDILLGKMIAYVVIGLSEAGLMMAVAVLVFGLTIHGSLLLVVLLSLVFLVASLSLGTLSGVFARNQVQAVQQVYPWVLLSVFLSGVFYPIESMPSFVQPFAYVIPLTYMTHAMRAIITKGAPLAVVSGDLAVLALYSLALLLLAFRAFRKKVE